MNKEIWSLTIARTICSTISSCGKPVLIATTATINESFTIARCDVIEVTGNVCPTQSTVWLKSTTICCKQ